MPAPGTPTNYNLQTGNIQNLLSWNIQAGATSYSVQRSTDGVNFTVLASPTTNFYVDEAVASGTQYWYKVAATNSDGTSPYTGAKDIIPAPTAEMALGTLRLLAQMRADKVNSNFITLPEWNSFINLAMYELYDLLIPLYDTLFMAPRARFNTSGNTFIYPLPNGLTTMQDANNSNFIPAPFYKLLGVDLAINSASNAFVSVQPYNLIDRNKYIYPNTASTIYGVFNLRYRMMGNNLELIPTPSANQQIQLLYIPRLPQLLQDTDITTIGFSGYLNYVVCRAAKYALDKEESDTSKLDEELIFIQKRVEAAMRTRDVGAAASISDTRNANGWGYGGQNGSNGPIGGW